MAVRFCEIGWLNVSVETCVFCSSVFSVRKRTLPLYDTTHKQKAGEFFLSQSTQSSLSIFAHSFEPMRRWPLPQPLPRREGEWLPRYPYCAADKKSGEFFLSYWGGFSLTELTDLTETFGAQFRAHRRPSAYRIHRTLQLKKGVGWWLLGVDD